MKFNFQLHKKVKGPVAFRKLEPAYRHPIRAWSAGLFAAVTLLTGGAIFLVIDFQHQMGATKVDIDVDIGEAKYRGGEVVQYADFYKKREETFSSLRETKPISDNNDEKSPEIANTTGTSTVESSSTETSTSSEVQFGAPTFE